MSTTLSFTDYGVRMGHRQFPREKVSRKKSKSESPADEIELSSPKLVAQRLSQRLLSLLPSDALSAQQTDRAALFANYTDCLNQLRNQRQEVLDLFRAIAETVFTHDLPDDPQCAAFIEVMLSESQVAFPLPRSGASAELGALSIEQIRSELQRLLVAATDEFVANVFSALDCLIDRSLVGLAHWTGQNSVRYHFFRRYAAVTAETWERTGESQLEAHNFMDRAGNLSRWEQVHAVEHQRELTCTLFHHKHDTVNAISTNLENAQVPMPDFVQALVMAIPSWLCPEMTVIDGYLIREQIFQREIHSQIVTQIEYEQELLYGHEPAVCLGPYVLTGWGPRDIAAMQSTDQSENHQTAAGNSSSFWFTCCFLAQGLTTLLLSTSASVLFPALLMFLVSGGCLAIGVQQQLRMTGVRISDWKLQLLLGGPVLLAASWQTLWLPLGVLAYLAGALLMLSGLFVIKLTRFFTIFHHNSTQEAST